MPVPMSAEEVTEALNGLPGWAADSWAALAPLDRRMRSTGLETRATDGHRHYRGRPPRP
mgnify:CR=1 FL=1